METTPQSDVLSVQGFPFELLPAEAAERYQSYSSAMRQLAETDPDGVALVFVPVEGADRELTWRGLFDSARGVAELFAERGVSPTSVVVIGLPNSVESVVSTFAAWHLGACVVPVRDDTPAPERDGLLALAAPDLVVANWTDVAWPTAGRDDVAAAFTRPATERPDLLAMPGKAIGSGGSTGKPKLIVTPYPWIHDREWAAADSTTTIGLAPGQRVLVPGPTYHNWPWDMTFRSLPSGRSVVLLEKFSAERALDAIERHRVNYVAIVPTMMRRMGLVPGVEQRDFSSLHAICHTAAPCPPAVKQRWIDLIGAERVYELYGATESLGLCVVRGDEWLARPGTVGKPVGCQVRILGEDGTDLPAGEIGSIYQRAAIPETSSYYVGAAAQSTGEGWFTLGDLGWVDEDGFVFIADRRTDLIITGGANVYPAEVEAALMEHPGIADAVVVGLPDPDLGRVVHAVVELVPGDGRPTTEDLRAHCAARLARPKVPRSFEIVEESPRSAAGKVRRGAITPTAEQPPAERSERPHRALLPMSVLVIALVVALSIWSSGSGSAGSAPTLNGAVSTASTPLVPKGAPSRGSDNAKVTVVEFADFQCEYCARHATTVLPGLLAKYGSRIRYVFRYYPIAQVHPQATAAAVAAECANRQGKFWPYHDVLFLHQEALDGPSLRGYAGQVGLDLDTFDDCLKNGDAASAVQRDVEAATALGVAGTPAFIVNGAPPILGAKPLETFVAAIDPLL